MRVGWITVAIGLVGFTTALTRAQNGFSALAKSDAVVCVLNDASTGERWVLKRDAAHPGGPGRLVRTEAGQGEMKSQPGAMAKPVIRAGDRVTVEEETAVVDARLEAVALGSAAAGELLAVRLVIGGRIAHAVAIAPERTRLVEEAR